jgi:hypothetical protein
MNQRQRRSAYGTCKPACEPLDGRVLLSGMGSVPDQPPTEAASPVEWGPYLGIIGVTPDAGTTPVGGVSALRLVFDRPLDAFSIGRSVRLEAIGSGAPIVMALVESLDEADPTVLVLTPDAPLTPGAYRLSLRAENLLSGLDGSTVEPTEVDRVVDQFTVAPPAPETSGPTDLGTVSGDVREVPGMLDLRADPGATALYRVRLGPSHGWWRLGLEVAARRQGVALRPVLALFSAEGRLLRASEFGRPDFPTDPYLFAGLPPGEYLVGVSGVGNVPGSPGGYDPASGARGRAAPEAGTGAFTLRLVAEPAEAATVVLGVRLDRADARSTSPTGFTVQFSGPMGPSDRSLGGSPRLEVVAADGRVWPVRSARYDEETLRLEAVLGRRLPEGTYTLRLAEGAGLTDLAGHVPVRFGLAAGELSRFRVAPVAAPQDPLDLGALYTDDAAAGITRAVPLLPDGEATVRLVVIRDGFVEVALATPAGAIAGRLVPESGGAAVPLEGAVTRVRLSAGAYLVRLASPGAAAVARLTITEPDASSESLLRNGLGQGPALGLRLVAAPGSPAEPPVAAAPAPVVVAGPAVTGPVAWSPVALLVLVPGPIAGPSGPGATSFGSGAGAGFGVGGLALGLNVEVVGAPPAPPSPAAPAVPPGPGPGAGQGNPVATGNTPFPGAGTAPLAGPPSPGGGGGEVDEPAILAAMDERVGVLGRALASVLFGPEESPLRVGPLAGVADAGPTLLAGVDDLGDAAAAVADEEVREAAGIDPAIALLAATVVAIRYRDGIRRRLGRPAQRGALRPAPHPWGRRRVPRPASR